MMTHEDGDDHVQHSPPIGYTMFPVPRDRLLRVVCLNSADNSISPKTG